MATTPRLILGCGEFGRRKLSKENACHALLDTFLSKGYQDVDGALMYGDGLCDKIIGSYCKRENLMIDSKIHPWCSGGLTRASVLSQAQILLDNLQTNCVDILYLHAPDHNTPLKETLGAVQQLFKEGKFKELGICNYASWEVVDIYHICKSNGWVLPTVYQGMYNPITRMVETELFPALRYLGIRFYAYNPTACGLLTGKYRYSDFLKLPEEKKDGRFFGDPKWSSLYQERYWRESTFKGLESVIQALDEVYAKDQVNLLQATYRWMTHHSKLSSADGILIGVSSIEHLNENVNACEEGPLHSRVVDAFQLAWEMDKVNCAPYFR